MEQDIGFEPMTFSLATKHSTTELILHHLASRQGLEPRPTVLETGMLPLHYRDIIFLFPTLYQ
jgi:hypothetical protein